MKHRTHLHIPGWLTKRKLLAAGMIPVILVAGFFVWQNRTTVPDQAPVITYSTDRPDESKQNADAYAWRGADDEPKRIIIPQIQVHAYVQKAGVDQNKQIAVPNNIHLAGWFVDSQKPGQNGLSIIAGHVTGRTTDGVFKQLSNLTDGDEFSVELGNGTVLHYRVKKTQTLKATESASVLFSQGPKVRSQLNLITCGGNFDEGQQQYENRVIVSAELV